MTKEEYTLCIDKAVIKLLNKYEKKEHGKNYRSKKQN